MKNHADKLTHRMNFNFTFHRLILGLFGLVLLKMVAFCPMTLADEVKTKTPLVVAIVPSAPMIMKDQNGQWTGIMIALWEHIASRLQWQYELREMSDIKALEALEKKEVDVAIGLLTVTSQKLKKIDFSIPYQASGMDIAILKKAEQSRFDATLNFLSSPTFLGICAILMLLLLTIGIVIWWIEHKNETSDFRMPVRHGLSDGVWWAAATLTTVGYGDVAPKTILGRMIGMSWMFASLVLSSILVSHLVTELNKVQNNVAPYQKPADLLGKKIGALKQSATAQYLSDRYNIQVIPFDHVVDGLQAVKEGKIDAYVGGQPTLSYTTHHFFAQDLDILDWNFGQQFYAIEFPKGSPLRETIDVELLNYINSTEWANVRKFFAQEWVPPHAKTL